MKRAQVPEGVIIGLVLIICVSTLYSIVVFHGKTAEAVVIPEKFIGMFDDAEKFSFYAEDFANLKLQESYTEIAKKSAEDCNVQIGIIPVWSDESSCKPNNQNIKNRIKLKFDEKYAGIGKPFISAVSDKLYVSFNPISMSISDATEFLSYNASYIFSPKFSISYPDSDFEGIYSAASAQKDKLALQNWNVAVENLTGHYVFTLNSTKSYFYENSFKPITIKFALEKQ